MSFFRFLKYHKKKTIFFVLLLAGVGWGAYSFRPKPVPYEFVQVESRNIIQQVSVTGSVTPDVSVDLAFEASGKVTNVYSDVGDAVTAGQPLVSLDDANISANLEQARAAVDAAEAKLSELLAGTREEEIAVQKVTLANTQRAYANAQNSVLTSAENAYTATDDAIRNKADKFFLDPRSADPKITLLLNSFGLDTTLKMQRVEMETMLSEWKKENDAMEISLVDVNTAGTVKRHLLQVRTFLDNCALALSIAIPNGSITQTVIDGYKTDISTSRTAINSAISALETAGDTLSSTKSSVDLQASNLALAEAPALPETILAQQAAIEQAEANVRSLEATLAKTVLRSPISGTVTMQNAKRGIIVTPGTPIVTVISKDQLKVEAFIPEADIAKVKAGDIASTTLDAYGDAVDFPVKVISIDPAQTVIEGVATYKTTFDFIKPDTRIKPGMTANIDILTEQKNNVPALPQRVLIRKDAQVFVQTSESPTVIPDVSPLEMPVIAGLRGSDGYTEIVSGLEVGDKVIVPKN